MKILGFEINRVGGNSGKSFKIPPPPPPNNKSKIDTKVTPPGARSSRPTSGNYDFGLSGLANQLNVVKPDFQIDAIPLIRKLYKVNEDIGSVLYDSIQLTNTGHTIKFDQSVKPELADKMREHLNKVSKNWHKGTAGIDGLINKWIAQIYVSGALSIEWVPNMTLTGVAQNVLVNPETIRFGLNKDGSYKTYQKTGGVLNLKNNGLHELNPNTYMYLSLFSDDDTPYGIPPFLTALKSIETQGTMKKNIDHILNQLGLLGYLEVTLDKPDQEPSESAKNYEGRLNRLLDQTRSNLLNGFKDGIVVGYSGDHEFDFHATTKNLAGVTEIFNLNERQVANGLKTSPSFLGVSTGSTESFMSIVFTKTLSQLGNTQQIISEALKKGYEMELALAGFNYNGSITIEFNASTITDDVKIQQSREYKQRVLKALWLDGIISQETYAEEMGYKSAFRKVNPEDLIPKPNDGNDIDKEDKDKDTKNKSARKTRETDKEQPKRKDNNVKP